MFERFTNETKEVMALANEEAIRRNHEYIGSEHILLGLLEENHGVASRVLKSLGADFVQASRELDKLLRNGPAPLPPAKRPLTPRAQKVFEFASDEVRKLNHKSIGTEHLLLAILRQPDGIAASVLTNLGLSLPQIREAVLREIASAGGKRLGGRG
jgi:ATP-dependent Clp protease ATP-binding subunit ClpC